LSDCIFCDIVAGRIPSGKVYEDELVYAFRDINPQAPTHILIVPKEHVGTVFDVDEEHESLVGHMIRVAAMIARDEGVEDGFRLVFNYGEKAGLSVFHLHLHLLGGRNFSWPPG